MALNRLITDSYNTFAAHADEAQVILLHPRSRYRSVLVARLLNDPDIHVFYYALGPEDISVDSFLSGIAHDLANQQPMFGRHIHALNGEEAADSQILMRAFAQDLGELSSQPFFLILDEYDRSDSADDVQVFIEKLVPLLPDHCRLVINSRTLPRLPWVSMIAQKRAALLEDTLLINHDFYDVPHEGSHNLEVYALGPGVVLLNGQPIGNWEGHLPRLLFFFALDKAVITRSEICQAFWPELEMDQAVNVFHVTKRRLHKALNMDVLVHDEGYYRINPELGIQYDVTDFVTYLMEGRNPDTPDPMGSWQRAVELYRGPFLQGHADGWILDRRRDFQAGYLEALSRMAEVRLAEDRKEHALNLYLKALTENLEREDLHRKIMALYTDLGRRSEAAGHYQRLVEDLKRFERGPEEATVELYRGIVE